MKSETNKTTEELLREMQDSSGSMREQLREYIILDRMGLVHSIAKKYKGTGRAAGQEYDDLVQAGMVGLMNAVDRYDPSRGVKFSSYATLEINGPIQNHLRDAGMIPAYIVEMLPEYEERTISLSQQLGRTPTFDEVADELGLSDSRRLNLYQALSFRNPVSLNLKNPDDDSVDDLSDRVENGSSLTMQVLDSEMYAIRNDIEKLPERLRTVVQLHYFQDRNTLEIGGEMDCSRSYVDRLLKDARKIIREDIKAQNVAQQEKPPVEYVERHDPEYVGLRERFLAELESDPGFRERLLELSSSRKTI